MSDPTAALARAQTLEECAEQSRKAVDDRAWNGDPNCHDAGYLDGWNAAHRFIAATYDAAAQAIRDQS